MKRFVCVMITTLAIGSVLTACSEEKEETKVESSSELDRINEDNEQVINNNEEKERMDRLEKKMLIYDESVIGGYYLITVNTKFQDLTIQYTINDDQSIKTAQLFYKYEGETEYKSIFLKDDSSGVYTYTISGMELAW